MKTRAIVALMTMVVFAAGASVASADEDEATGAAVAKFLPGAKVTLQQGLTAAESQGLPISGKFEVDEGHFQLSVYTAQGGKFSEVIVDYTTGKVAKSEAITGGEDLAEAQKQMAAVAKAKQPLKSAVDKAEVASVGYRAIAVTPNLVNGHAVAAVTLLRGTQTKSVSESLE